MIPRGTTPTQRFTIPFSASIVDKVKVIFSQEGEKKFAKFGLLGLLCSTVSVLQLLVFNSCYLGGLNCSCAGKNQGLAYMNFA